MMPRLEFRYNVDTGAYAILGFEELDHWARLNDVGYCKLTTECCLMGLSEMDRRTMLLVYYMRLNNGLLEPYRGVPPGPFHPLGWADPTCTFYQKGQCNKPYQAQHACEACCAEVLAGQLKKAKVSV